MAKWVMPHEAAPAEQPTESPTGLGYNFILPHVEYAKREEEKAAKKTAAQEKLARMGGVERFLAGTGQSIADLYLGGKQSLGMLSNLLPGEPSAWPGEVSDVLRETRDWRQALAEDPAAIAGRVGTGAVAGMALPASRALPAAMAGAALAGPLTPREKPSWEAMAGDALLGTGAGVAGSVVGGALASGIGRTKNALMGNMADPAYRRRMDIAKEYGVPLSVGDITQSPTWTAIENTVQHIPYTGRKEFLERQAQRLGEVVETAPERIVGPTPARSKEDLGKTLEKSIKDRYKVNRDVARNLYDNVSSAVKQAGAPPVPPTTLQSTAKQLKTDYPNIFESFQDSKAVSRLNDIIEGTGPQSSAILGPTGQPLTKPAAIDFDDMRWLDQRLGSMIRQGRRQMLAGNMDPEAFNQLTSLQSALRNDITNWSQNIGAPEIAEGVAKANDYFRKNVVPFREDPVTKKVIRGEWTDTDKLPAAMFKKDSPTRTERSLEFLTPEGVQAGRFHMVNEASRRALGEDLESGYSAAQFLRGSALGETGPKIYSPDQLSRIDDLRELIRSTRRASSYAADPATGNRLLGLTPFVSWKMPVIGRMLASAMQEPRALQLALANPRMYTGKGGLGRMVEEAARRAPAGGAGTSVTLPETPPEDDLLY